MRLYVVRQGRRLAVTAVTMTPQQNEEEEFFCDLEGFCVDWSLLWLWCGKEDYTTTCSERKKKEQVWQKNVELKCSAQPGHATTAARESRSAGVVCHMNRVL